MPTQVPTIAEALSMDAKEKLMESLEVRTAGMNAE